MKSSHARMKSHSSGRMRRRRSLGSRLVPTLLRALIRSPSQLRNVPWPVAMSSPSEGSYRDAPAGAIVTIPGCMQGRTTERTSPVTGPVKADAVGSTVLVEPQFAAAPELPLLICLGQYMRILAQRARVGGGGA